MANLVCQGSRPQSAMQPCQSTQKSVATRRLSGRLTRSNAAEAATARDDFPNYRVPISPHRFRLLAHHLAGNLGDAAENFRDGAGECLVLQHLPFRVAAHDWRANAIDNLADPGLARAVAAHRARLDISI